MLHVCLPYMLIGLHALIECMLDWNKVWMLNVWKHYLINGYMLMIGCMLVKIRLDAIGRKQYMIQRLDAKY